MVMLLQQQSFNSNYMERQEVFQNIMDSYPDGAWGIFCGKELIGYIFFHPYYENVIKPLNSCVKLDGNEDCMYLHEMNISPKHRRMGFPKILFKKFDELTKASNYNIQCLVAVQDSAEYWRKFGFKRIRGFNDSGYTNGVYMQRFNILSFSRCENPQSLI